MYLVDSISADAKQKQTLILDNGTAFTIEMEYKPQQSGWFFTSIFYNDIEIKNVRICTSPNMLHQFKNKIPFGICVTSKQNFEPTQQGDFLSGNSVMYILTQAETAQYAAYLTNG